MEGDGFSAGTLFSSQRAALLGKEKRRAKSTGESPSRTWSSEGSGAYSNSLFSSGARPSEPNRAHANVLRPKGRPVIYQVGKGEAT